MELDGRRAAAMPKAMGSGISTRVKPILTCLDTALLDERAEVQAAIDRVGEATLKVDDEPGALQLAVDHLTALIVRHEAGTRARRAVKRRRARRPRPRAPSSKARRRAAAAERGARSRRRALCAPSAARAAAAESRADEAERALARLKQDDEAIMRVHEGEISRLRAENERLRRCWHGEHGAPPPSWVAREEGEGAVAALAEADSGEEVRGAEPAGDAAKRGRDEALGDSGRLGEAAAAAPRAARAAVHGIAAELSFGAAAAPPPPPPRRARRWRQRRRGVAPPGLRGRGGRAATTSHAPGERTSPKARERFDSRELAIESDLAWVFSCSASPGRRRSATAPWS